MASSGRKSAFQFLLNLKENNNRDWMQLQKKKYLEGEKELKLLYTSIEANLNKIDTIERVKIFRINRDVRFSNDKTPYNVHRSVNFSREGAHRRGSYYLRLEPGKSMMAGGFFEPSPSDLFRIRKEFEMDGDTIHSILNEKKFRAAFQNFNQEYKVKTAPKGFNKEDKNIELIRLKSFFVTHSFTDDEVFSPAFADTVTYYFTMLHPFFNYMSDVLTTDLNGESLL